MVPVASCSRQHSAQREGVFNGVVSVRRSPTVPVRTARAGLRAFSPSLGEQKKRVNVLKRRYDACPEKCDRMVLFRVKEILIFFTLERTSCDLEKETNDEEFL